MMTPPPTPRSMGSCSMFSLHASRSYARMNSSAHDSWPCGGGLGDGGGGGLGDGGGGEAVGVELRGPQSAQSLPSGHVPLDTRYSAPGPPSSQSPSCAYVQVSEHTSC